MSTATVQCENCGKDITRERNSINRSKHHFCDLSCSDVGRWIIYNPYGQKIIYPNIIN